MFSDRGIDVGGLTFGKGRVRITLETVDGRPSLVIRGDSRAALVLDIGRLNIAPATGDPATPQDGDIWYDDTSGLFQFRQEGVTESLSGDDAPVDATFVTASANATLTAELVLGTDVIMAGAAAARPAAGTAGRLYLETDTNGGTLFRDTGAAWVQAAFGVSAAAGHTIRENGTDQTTRTGLNFIDADAGAGLITDDAVGNETEVNLNLYLLASGARVMTGDLDMGGNDILSARNMYPDPGGRLTLTSATPVMVAEAAAQTTLYYALYKHDLVPLYDGTDWDVFRFTELSIAMAASANWAADSNFDCYVYNDGGTLRLVTGAAWTSDTARNETLTRINGRWTNNASMTGRYGAASTVTVAANRGLYVGTIRTTGTAGTTTWELGGSAVNGDPGFFYVWNAYNRVPVSAIDVDSTASWTYASATIRSKNASTSNRFTFVRGLNEDAVQAWNTINAEIADNEQFVIGWGLDSTTAYATESSGQLCYMLGITSGQIGSNAFYSGTPGLGLHFLQALEGGDTGTMTFYGISGDRRSALGIALYA